MKKNTHISFYKSKLLSVLLFLALFTGAVSAQSFSISGTVKDNQSNEPLPFATVVINGTVTGTSTDLSGAFRISGIQPKNYTLKVTYVGYDSKDVEVVVSKEDVANLDIKLSPSGILMKELTISTQRLGQSAAINQQLNSNAIVNVVSKDRIRELPDVNVAEAIGRLPGVSLVRSQGEGSKVVLRGLNPKFSTVSINGVKQAPTGASDRSVDLSGISPELLSGVEVYKSPTADMDGDAIGGNINLIIQKAPDIKKNQFRLYGGYGDLNNAIGNYKASWEFSSRFLKKKLGVMAQATYESMDRGAQGIDINYFNPDAQVADSFFISDIQLINREQKTQRYGANLFLDYQFKNASVYFSNMYNASPRQIYEQSKTINRSNGAMTMDFESTETKNQTINSTLGGVFNLKVAKVDWSVNRVQMDGTNPYQMSLRFMNQNGLTPGSAGMYTLDPTVLLDSLKYTSARSSIDTTTYLERAFWTPDTTKQRSYSAKIDIEIPFNLSDELGGFIKFGGKINSDSRERIIVKQGEEQYYLFGPTLKNEVLTNEPGLKLTKDGMISLQNFANNQPTNIFNNQYEFWPSAIESKIRDWKTNHTSELKNNPSTKHEEYSSTERVSAAYIMMKLNYKDILTFIPGLRYEYSNNEYHSYYSTVKGANGLQGYYKPTESTKEYGELLPSVHAKIKPLSWFDIRISAAKTLTRPDFSMVMPRFYYNSAVYTVSKGNPDLKHATSWNYDVSATVFSNKIGMITLGAFYKKIDDMFYRTSGTMRPEEAEKWDLPAQTFDLSEDYINLNDSWVKGLEFDVNTHFEFLPAPFNRFALGFNVTSLSSQTYYLVWKKIEGLVYYKDVRPILSVDFDKSYYQKTPSRMPSQVDLTANGWLGYDYKGFSGRVSVGYQGTRLNSVNTSSLELGYNTYGDEYLRVDASFKQKINKNLSVLLNLNNLTNAFEGGYRFQPQYPTGRTLYGFTADLGLQVSL